MRKLRASDILISENRQRQEFAPEELMDLTTSIANNGLLHPVVVRAVSTGDWYLVAGERRLRAIQNLYQLGEDLWCDGEKFAEGFVPVVSLGDLSPLEAEEAELDENIKRTDLTWQERANATNRLATLRAAQAVNNQEPIPTTGDIAQEVRGSRKGINHETTRREIIVAKYLEDKEVSSAKNLDEAFKLLKRKEVAKRNVQLAEEIGKTHSRLSHQIVLGDAREMLRNGTPSEHYDVILTDPPYGIDANEFGDCGGKVPIKGHDYDDSFKTWLELMQTLATESFRVTKPQAHMYVFCDLGNFEPLKELLGDVGWKCFRTPIIWHKPNGNRAPWPDMGPQRKYETILFAVKGSKKVNRLFSDLVTYPSDENLGWAAQKPVALYEDLLKRSIIPGDKILDPFCGTGPIFPAGHSLLCEATGFERDKEPYGIACKRIEELL